MNQVATMLTSLLSNRRSLETLQSYKKYCDPVIDDWDEEILTTEEITQAVDLPSLYEKYCSENQELSIIDDSESTASSCNHESHQSDNLQVYQTDWYSKNEDEHQEDFEEGECSSSSGHDNSALHDGRESRHDQQNARSCDEMYLNTEASPLCEVKDVEEADYDEDWVEGGRVEPDEASECASLCLSTVSSCSTSSSSLQSRMRDEGTQNIPYPLPPRQLMHFTSPPVHIAALMKRKKPNKTEIRPPYLTQRSPYLDCSYSTELILLSRRPCYRSTQTTNRGTSACAAARCMMNPRVASQTTDRLSNSVYVRASLTSTAAAARSSAHRSRSEKLESVDSPSTVGHIYNSGKLGNLKKSISELDIEDGRAHQKSSRRKVEDALRCQVIDIFHKNSWIRR
jgi:hypothetical protein